MVEYIESARKERNENNMENCDLKMGEITGEWRKLFKDKLRNLLVSRDILRMVESQRVKWTRLLISRRCKRNAHIVFFIENFEKGTIWGGGEMLRDGFKVKNRMGQVQC